LLSCAPQSALNPCVFRIGFPAGPPCIRRDQFLLDEFVELVQVDVTEDRGHDPALRTAAERFVVFPVFQVPGLEHVSDEPEESLVVDFLREYGQEDFMPEAAEAVADVTLDEPYGASPGVVDFA
jgi:hypothetical protein